MQLLERKKSAEFFLIKAEDSLDEQLGHYNDQGIVFNRLKAI